MDPIDVEVIRNSFRSMLEETETNICETAFSPIIYEVRDFSTALLTPDGEFIAQGIGGVPIFLGDLDAPVKDMVERKSTTMRAGDVYITNEAAVCGQHLNNLVAMRPIFFDGAIEAIAVVRVHLVDIGGRAAGGWVSDTTEIYQEGLQLPCVLVARDGVLLDPVLELISANVRYPEPVIGDLRAQIAATGMLEDRFRALRQRYTGDQLESAIKQIWEDSAALARASTEDWREGSGTAQARFDTMGLDHAPQVSVTVTKESTGRIIVDYAGTSSEVPAPINSKYGAAVAARIAYKILTLPDRTADEGAFQNLTISVPAGTFLSCSSDAPLAQWSAPLPTVVDTVLAAMGQLVDGHVAAAHHGELGGFALFGEHPDTGEAFYQIDTITGGWGGTPSGPGRSALKSNCHGDTYTTPVEVEERHLPLVVRAYRLNPGSGGEGEHPGGLGTERVYEIPVTTYLNLGLVRGSLPPWGVNGGGDAIASEVIIERPGRDPEHVLRGTGIELPPGTVLTIRSGGGGGHGARLES